MIYNSKDFKAEIDKRESRDGTKYGVKVSVRTYTTTKRTFWTLRPLATADTEPDEHYARYDEHGFPTLHSGSPFWGNFDEATKLFNLVVGMKIQARCRDSIDY
jgi:hypothetical protein